MLAPLATIAFLAALWLVAKLLLDRMDRDGTKVVAALAGRSVLAQPPQSVRSLSVRFQPRAESVRRPMRVQPEWRAAA